MPLNIRSEEVNRLAEQLAARVRRSKTDAVKLALENELRRLDEAVTLHERLRPLQRRIMARPATGEQADKAFYDDLSGEPRSSSMRRQSRRSSPASTSRTRSCRRSKTHRRR
jgi:antitoxin VapB